MKKNFSLTENGLSTSCILEKGIGNAVSRLSFSKNRKELLWRQYTFFDKAPWKKNVCLEFRMLLHSDWIFWFCIKLGTSFLNCSRFLNLTRIQGTPYTQKWEREINLMTVNFLLCIHQEPICNCQKENSIIGLWEFFNAEGGVEEEVFYPSILLLPFCLTQLCKVCTTKTIIWFSLPMLRVTLGS